MLETAVIVPQHVSDVNPLPEHLAEALSPDVLAVVQSRVRELEREERRFRDTVEGFIASAGAIVTAWGSPHYDERWLVHSAGTLHLWYDGDDQSAVVRIVSGASYVLCASRLTGAPLNVALYCPGPWTDELAALAERAGQVLSDRRWLCRLAVQEEAARFRASCVPLPAPTTDGEGAS